MTGSSLAIQTEHLVTLPVPQTAEEFKERLLKIPRLSEVNVTKKVIGNAPEIKIEKNYFQN